VRKSQVKWFLIAVAVAIFAVLLAVPASVFAQSASPGANSPGDAVSPIAARGGGDAKAKPSSPPRPTPRAPDGKPDLSGVWDGRGGYVSADSGGPAPYTPAGQAAYQYNMTQAVDPQSLCILIGQPRADLDGRPFEIVQNSNRVAFLYERDTSWRVVRVDGSQHPKDFDPTFFGDAVGTWDGDTLVVDVVAVKGEKVWSDNNGHPHSDAAHIVERWSRPDADHLQLDVTIDDPKYYTQPIHVTRKLRLQSYLSVDEEACDENNVDREHLGPGLGTKSGRRGFDPPPQASPGQGSARSTAPPAASH
jgi:hypothetical protein